MSRNLRYEFEKYCQATSCSKCKYAESESCIAQFGYDLGAEDKDRELGEQMKVILEKVKWLKKLVDDMKERQK